METQILIAIGREYGTGGHEIGEKLAKRLNIGFYDRNMLDRMFAHHEESKKEIEKFDEQASNMFLTRRVRGFSSSIEENLAEMQFDFIRKRATEGESFVICGRCGESVLRDYKNMISVFVRGDMPEKIQRVMEKYNVDDRTAMNKIARHDRNRRRYHNTYSDFKWGDALGYDICINSSKTGSAVVVDTLYDYVIKAHEHFKERK